MIFPNALHKKRKPIRRVSVARSKQLREYKKVKHDFLEVNPLCFSCGKLMPFDLRELHHFYGRVGRLLTWMPGFRTVCQKCHYKIHTEPSWAIAVNNMAPMGTFNDFARAQKHYEQMVRG